MKKYILLGGLLLLSLSACGTERSSERAKVGQIGAESSVSREMAAKTIALAFYTNQELASVGKTEEELIANGESFRVQKIPMTYSGRFVAENENGNGLCKLITDDEDRIIGCHLLGNPASEIIVTAGIAVENGYTVDEFKKNIFPHPTVSEILHESLYI